MLVRIGQQLGEYRLIRILGQGAFAEVYLGEHLLLHIEHAIKVLRAPMIDQEDQFLEEARQIAALESHPHIVRVLNFAIDRNGPHPVPYLVMEYAPHGSIRQRYPRGTRLAPAQIISHTKQIASALDHAHVHKLVHRDIKPENILIGKDGTLLLSDFGIAVIFQQEEKLNNTQAIAGTKAYIAPEQILGNPRPQSDQFALGVMVYEWLCGTSPFPIREKATMAILMERLNNEPLPLRSTGLVVSPKVEYVMQRVLAKNPEERFSTVSAFAQALEGALQKEQPSVRLPPHGNEPPPLPNDTTFKNPSERDFTPVSGSNPVPSPTGLVHRGLLPPPMPHSLLTMQPKTPAVQSKPAPALNPAYFYAPQWAAFRMSGLFLTAISALLLSFVLQNGYVWIPCLLVTMPLFILCILLSKRQVATLLTIPLACYWAFVGGTLYATVAGSGPIITVIVATIVAFCISLLLLLWYVFTKKL
jgi:serine/threonine protein kinase